MNSEELVRLGFTKNESKVYLAVLELGLSTITKIVSRTHLHKQIIYDNLEKLSQKGLVAYVMKGKKKNFSAASPEKINALLGEEQKELKEKKELLEKLIPELILIRNSAVEKQIASIFHGKEGIKTILEEILKYNKEVYAFGAEGKFKAILGIYWINYNQKRQRLKQKWKIIYNQNLKDKRSTLTYVELKFIPKEFENPASTIVFGNKTAIILWEDVPTGILIESEKITKSYKSTFNLLWKFAKK